MAVIVGTDSYSTEAELLTYATARLIDIDESPTVLLIKAMDWLELQPFQYEKTDDDQALEFPRNAETTVPDKIKIAQMVAALLIDSGVDLLGAVDRAVKSKEIPGVIAITYMDNSTETTRYPKLAALLRDYVVSGMTVSRG